MSDCAAKHPEIPSLSCTLPRGSQPHGRHLAVRHLPGTSEPETVVWTDPSYKSPQQLRDEARAVRTKIETSAATVRAGLASQASKPLPGQRKKTRLGQVANMLVNHVGEWIDGHRLETVEIGGSSGLRRLRELRDDYGWKIEQRPTATSTDQYRLVELPDEFKGRLNGDPPEEQARHVEDEHGARHAAAAGPGAADTVAPPHRLGRHAGSGRAPRP